MTKRLWLLTGLFLLTGLLFVPGSGALAQENKGDNDKTFVYAKTDQGELKLYVTVPPNWKESDHRSAIIFFGGNDWTKPAPKQFQPFADYLSKRGMVAIQAQFRGKTKKGSAEADVEDAQNAIKWVRENAKKLGVDPEKIAAGGGAAGAHIAGAAFFMAEDDKEKPSALVMFDPVMDTRNYASRFANAEAAMKYSLTSHGVKKLAPTLVVITAENPFRIQISQLGRMMAQKGTKFEFYVVSNPGQRYGFHLKAPGQSSALAVTDRFLVKIGFLTGEPTAKINERAPLMSMTAAFPGAPNGAGFPQPGGGPPPGFPQNVPPVLAPPGVNPLTPPGTKPGKGKNGNKNPFPAPPGFKPGDPLPPGESAPGVPAVPPGTNNGKGKNANPFPLPKGFKPGDPLPPGYPPNFKPGAPVPPGFGPGGAPPGQPPFAPGFNPGNQGPSGFPQPDSQPGNQGQPPFPGGFNPGNPPPPGFPPPGFNPGQPGGNRPPSGFPVPDGANPSGN